MQLSTIFQTHYLLIMRENYTFKKAGYKDRQHEPGGGSVGKGILVKARIGGTIYNPSAL